MAVARRLTHRVKMRAVLLATAAAASASAAGPANEAVELARSSPELWAKLNPSDWRRRSKTEQQVKTIIQDAAKLRQGCTVGRLYFVAGWLLFPNMLKLQSSAGGLFRTAQHWSLLSNSIVGTRSFCVS